MKTIDLKQKLKELYPNHRYVDKHDLISLQYTADDMIEFAKQISDIAIELAAENAEYETEGYYDEHLSIWVDRQSILNTKNQIK